MEYQKNKLQKIHQINELNVDKKNWVEINDDSRGTYKTNSQIKFQTSMFKSSLCGYSNAYIFVSVTIAITGVGNDDVGRRLDERNKE